MDDRAVQPVGDRPPEEHRFNHEGHFGEIGGIAFVNGLLTLLTLTIYRFWARTRVRAYLWSRTTLFDDAFEYTGTGMELFLGFLIVFLLVLIPLGIANGFIDLFIDKTSPIAAFAGIALFATIFFLYGMARFRARRYRLSRTTWRGIRCGQSGSSAAFGGKFLAFFALLFVTLGLTYPLQRVTLFGELMGNTWFGDRRFSFRPNIAALYPRFFGAIGVYLLAAVAIGLAGVVVGVAFAGEEASSDQGPNAAGLVSLFLGLFLAVPVGIAWYRLGEFRNFAKSTQFGDVTFRFEGSFAGLLWLGLSNLVLVLVTLGFALPVAQMRKFRYACRHLIGSGPPDVSAIAQRPPADIRVGEGLADAFDLGTI